jgi:hypothetical protein
MYMLRHQREDWDESREEQDFKNVKEIVYYVNHLPLSLPCCDPLINAQK